MKCCIDKIKQNKTIIYLLCVWVVLAIFYIWSGIDISTTFVPDSIFREPFSLFILFYNFPFSLVSGMIFGWICLFGVKKCISQILFGLISLAIISAVSFIIPIPYSVRTSSGHLGNFAVDFSGYVLSLNMLFWSAFSYCFGFSGFIWRKLLTPLTKKIQNKDRRSLAESAIVILGVIASIALFLLIFNIVEGMI